MKLKKALSRIVASMLAASITLSGAIPAGAETSTISFDNRYGQQPYLSNNWSAMYSTDKGIANEYFDTNKENYYIPLYKFYGKNTYGFCIQPSARSGATNSGTTITSKEATTFWRKVLAKGDMQNALGLAMYYGYPKTSTSRDYYVATQLLLWEFTMGYRDYTKGGSYELNPNGISLFNKLTVPYGAYCTRNGIYNAYTQIVSNMAKHAKQPGSKSSIWSSIPDSSINSTTVPVLYDYSTNTWRTQSNKLNVLSSDLTKNGINWSTIPTGLKTFAEAQNVKGSVSNTKDGNYTKYQISWNKKPFSGGSVKNSQKIDAYREFKTAESWIVWSVSDNNQTMLVDASIDPVSTYASFAIPNYADVPIQKYWEIDNQILKGNAPKDYMEEVYWYARIGDKNDAVVDGKTKYIIADKYTSNGVSNYVFQGTTTDRSKATKFKIDVNNWNGSYGYNATTGYGKTVIYDVPCDFTESGTSITPKSVKITLEEYLPDGGKAVTAGFPTKYSDGTRKRATVTIPTFSTSSYKVSTSLRAASFKNALNPRYTHVFLEKEVVSTDKNDLTNAALAKAYKDMQFVAFYYDGNKIHYLKNLSADGNTKDGNYTASSSIQGTEYAFNSTGLTDDIAQAQKLTPGYADASGQEVTSNSQELGEYFGKIFIDKIPLGVKIGFIELKSSGNFGYDEDQKTVVEWSNLLQYLKGSAGKDWAVVKYNGTTVNNYLVNGQTYPIVVSENTTNDRDINVSMTNQPYYFNATVLKQDDDGHPLDNCVIGLYASETAEKPIETRTTDAEGKVTFNTKITANDTYYYEEVTPKAGYIKDSNRYKVDTNIAIAELKNAYLGTVLQDDILVNHPTQTHFTKTDVTKNENIVGAKLCVTDLDGNVIDTWTTTTDNTKHTIEKLEVGKTYIYKEIEAPAGYVTAAPVQFTVNKSGRTNVNMVDLETETYVSKKDIVGEDELEGATLIVTDETGKEVDRWVSGKTPHLIKKLVIGKTYTLTEITAPDGYTKAESVEFTINEDGVTKVSMTDKPTETYVSKKDITGEDELEGATLIVTDADGNEIDKWVSGKTEHLIKKLHIGKTYTLTEITAPDGYTKAESIEFTINEDGVTKVSMTDKPTETYLSKKDITDKSELEGATMIVTDAEGNEIDKWVSGKEPHIITKLHIGKTYTLTELTAPDGYVKAESVEFTVEEDGVTHVEMLDQPTETYFTKVDITTQEELEGATMIVMDENGETVDQWVSGKEPHVITKLHIGKTYTLVEITAPDGYVKAESVEFTVGEDGITHVKMEDAPTTTYFSKQDITNQEELPGATLIVTDEEGNEVETWVSTDTPHIITRLKVGGTYTLTELTAPDGYVKAESVTFTVGEDGITHVKMEDKPTEVYVSKKDITNKEELPGATLVITDSEGNEIDKWVSTTEPHIITKLLIGEEYTLTEITAPDGYLIAESIKFVLTEEGVEHVDMYDTKTPTKISKVDITGKAELPGATLEVYDADGNLIETWVSGNEPHYIYGLTAGKEYTLVEKTAPNGYLVAESVKFIVDAHDETSVTMEDDYTKLEILKVDENGNPLAGARLQLLDAEGNIIDEWTSTTEPHRVDKLTVGAEYTLREVTAPDGYDIAADQSFTIKEDTEVQKVEMQDTKTPHKTPNPSTGAATGTSAAIMLCGVITLFIAKKKDDNQ